MRILIRTLLIFGGLYFFTNVAPAFVVIHPALQLLVLAVFAALVPELEKRT